MTFRRFTKILKINNNVSKKTLNFKNFNIISQINYGTDYQIYLPLLQNDGNKKICFSFRVVALEREKTTHLYSKRSEFRHDFSILEELDSKLTGDIKSERKSFRLIKMKILKLKKLALITARWQLKFSCQLT